MNEDSIYRLRFYDSTGRFQSTLYNASPKGAYDEARAFVNHERGSSSVVCDEVGHKSLRKQKQDGEHVFVLVYALPLPD